MLSWYVDGILHHEINLKRIRGKQKVILFGKNRRNRILFQQISCEDIICVFRSNWDEDGMEELYEELLICDPTAGIDGVVVSPLYDWKNISEQALQLGYSKVYFFIPQEATVRMEQYIQQFTPLSKINRIPTAGRFRYVHLVPDQKFFLPVTDMIEYGMDMQEHFFVIHSIFRGEENAEYGSWKKYRELMLKYGNVYLLHNIRPLYLSNWPENQKRLTELLEYADKIIIHSEYHIGIVEDPYWKTIIPLIQEKGVCIPWGGFLRNHGSKTDQYIQEIIQYVRLCVTPQWMRWRIVCDKYPELYNTIRIDNGLSYARLTKVPEQKGRERRNVLISHSAVAYTNTIQTMDHLAGQDDSLILYSITSYGAQASKIEQEGEIRLGKRFVPIKHFMEYQEYVEFLATMDVAVFGMDVMAGRDTIELLFWLGVKVYLKPESQVYQRMKGLGYRIADYYTVPSLSLEKLMNNPDEEWNRSIAAREFDPEEKVRQWRELYEYDFGTCGK